MLLTFKWYVFMWQKCSMLKKYANFFSSTNGSVFQCLKTVLWCFNEQDWLYFAPTPSINPHPSIFKSKMFFLIIYSFQFKFLSTFFNLMRGTLEWNERGIKWLLDLLLRMVYVLLCTIFYWESDNPNKTFPVICLDLWKILCFRSNLFRRKMFDYILLRY